MGTYSTQPPAATGLDTGHALYSKLKFVYNAADAANVAVLAAGATASSHLAGVHFRTVGSENALYGDVGSGSGAGSERWATPTAGAPYAVVALVKDSVGRGTSRSPVGGDDGGGGSHRVFQFYVNASNVPFFLPFDVAVSPVGATGPGATSSSAQSVIVGRVDASKVATCWLDGVSGTPAGPLSSATRALGTAFDYISIGCAGDDGQPFLGDILAIVVMDAPSDSEITTYLDSPAHFWSIFAGGPVTNVAFTGTVPTLNGAAASAFSASLTSYFSGSQTPYTYTLQSGTLPSGLSLSSAGVISGTPASAGTSSGLVVRATDTGTNTADTNSFSIVVAAAATSPAGSARRGQYAANLFNF